MADVTVNLETDNPEELVNQGIKAFNLADFNVAVSALSRAVELLAAKHGDKHDSLGVAYFYYGKALLEVYREEVEPLGDAVPRDLDSDSGEDDSKEEVTTEEKSKTNEDASQSSNAIGKPPEDNSVVDTKVDTAATNGEANNDKPSSSDVGDTNAEGDDPSNSEAQAAEEEEPTDLQVAWEVLELAKMIFDERGESGKKELAETFILLGEISLESENFVSAIDDIKRGLEIQKATVEDNSRTLAQTYYKLAVALSTNNQIDEAIVHFNISSDILKNRVKMLTENAETNKEEIEDIESLIPEIDEKIADMKSFKEEAAIRLIQAMQAKSESNGPFDAGSSSAAVNDISHLIKRKRKPDEEDDKPTKKLSE